MATTTRSFLRSSSLAAAAVVAAASFKTPSLLAQSTGSIRASATVVSVAPEREAEQQAHAEGLRLVSAVGAQREVSQRVSTVSRLAQVTTARVSAVRNGRAEEQTDLVRVTVEYAAN